MVGYLGRHMTGVKVCDWTAIDGSMFAEKAMCFDSLEFKSRFLL